VTKEFSIADARRNLPSVVNAVESGAEVRLTRRGRPVAVVVSMNEYARLTGNRTSFAEALSAFRRRFPTSASKLRRSDFASLRDRSKGRKIKL
jgi:prevent-host-death family protein